MMRTSKIFHCLIIICGLLLQTMVRHTQGQTLEPRLYNNLPTNLNFLILGYGYSEGDVLVDPSIPLEDLKARLHIPVMAYVRSLNVWGRSGKIDVVIPYARLSGSAMDTNDDQLLTRDISGFADPSFRLTVNFFGAPSLSLKEFPHYKQKSILGVSMQLLAPLGQYDSSKLANIGTNRWTFKPELGFSHALGPLLLEVSSSVSFYTTNEDFWGGHTRKQDPILSIQGHTVYSFSSGVWLAFDIAYYTGGQTIVDGETKNDLQTNWRSGATIAIPITRSNALKVNASTGLYTRTGTDFNLFGIAWVYRWVSGS